MRAAVALGLAAVTLVSCGKPKPLYIDHAWVRLAAAPSNPAAAYFNIHGGPADHTLISVTTDVAIKAEMHQSMTAAKGNISSMKPVRELAIPAKSLVTFAPGGRHVMLYDMNPGIKPGSTITLTFAFSDGERILQNAGVIGAGDPAPE